jgi:hypothetical protein
MILGKLFDEDPSSPCSAHPFSPTSGTGARGRKNATGGTPCLRQGLTEAIESLALEENLGVALGQLGTESQFWPLGLFDLTRP